MNAADRAAVEAVEAACSELRDALNAAARLRIECAVECSLTPMGRLGDEQIYVLYDVKVQAARTTVERFRL